MILRIAARAHAQVALLELLVAHQNLRCDRRRLLPHDLTGLWHGAESLLHQLADAIVFEIADGGHDQVRRGVRVAKIIAEEVDVERFDRFTRAENRPPQRVVFPEALREELVDEVVGRVLDHLDLFDDDFLLALDVLGAERRVADDIGEDVDRERQMLVEDFDVVARVLLGGERVELPADGVNRLGNILGRAAGGALEQHVLDEMRDAPALSRLVAGAPGEPYADADRADLRHLLGEKAKPVIENVPDDR